MVTKPSKPFRKTPTVVLVRYQQPWCKPAVSLRASQRRRRLSLVLFAALESWLCAQMIVAPVDAPGWHSQHECPEIPR
jgi:hypothetical protein